MWAAAAADEVGLGHRGTRGAGEQSRGQDDYPERGPVTESTKTHHDSTSLKNHARKRGGQASSVLTSAATQGQYRRGGPRRGTPDRAIRAVPEWGPLTGGVHLPALARHVGSSLCCAVDTGRSLDDVHLTSAGLAGPAHMTMMLLAKSSLT